MPTINRETLGLLHDQITVTVPRSEYTKKYAHDLERLRKRTDIKGFRKGKAPLSMVRSMYGSALGAELVNKMVTEALDLYLRENQVRYLAQPMFSAHAQPSDLTEQGTEDLVFPFEIGLMPEVDLNISESLAFDYYSIIPDEDTLRKSLEARQESMGTRETVAPGDDQPEALTTPIEAKDYVYVEGVGLDADLNPTDLTFSNFINLANAEPEFAAQLVGKFIGHEFTAALTQLSTVISPERLHTFYFGEDKDTSAFGGMVQAKVTRLSRQTKAELNQAFFDQAFGADTVHSEAEAMEALRKEFVAANVVSSDMLFYAQVKDFLKDHVKVELPEDFLKRWYADQEENRNKELSEHTLTAFLEDMRWALVRNELIMKFNVRITEADLFEKIKERIREVYSFMDEMMLHNLANRYMQEQDFVSRTEADLIREHLAAGFKGFFTLRTQEVTADEFNKIVEEVQKKVAPVAVPVTEE